MGQKDSHFGMRIAVELAQGWAQDAGTMQYLDDDSLQMFVDCSHRCADFARGRALMASRSNCMAWIKKQWKEKPRLAHAHVKPQTGPEKEMRRQRSSGHVGALSGVVGRDLDWAS
eukprot:22974-Pyramimonas_sp.AAC.1